jgi:GntR family transcriptional repressor for pyruvate dehydrogenase complex
MKRNERFFYASIAKPLLYEEVINKLLEAINNGYIKAGEKFPTDREIVERWKISRNVLREAFHILGERGIITSIQGKGRFLRKLPEKEMWNEDIIKILEKSSLREIYEVRKVLELYALELASEKASGQDIKTVNTLYQRLSKRFRKTGKTTGEFELHMGYARLSGNFFLEHMLSLTLKRITEFMSSTFDEVLRWHGATDIIEDIIREHGLILRHIKQGKTQEAQAIIVEHFNRTIERIESF